MESFEEIIKNCILNKNNDDLFEENYHKLLNCEKVQNIINSFHYDKKHIEATIKLLLKEHNFKKIPPLFSTFQNALNEEINKIKGREKIDYRIKKNQPLISLNTTMYDDSSCTYEDNVSGTDNVEENIEMAERDEFEQELKAIGLKEELYIKFMLKLYDFSSENGFEDIQDCITILNINKTWHSKIKSLLMFCGKKSVKVRKLISSFFSFSVYEKFVGYLLEANNNKLKIPELIIDFNKIRSYLSVLVYNDDIKNKTSFINKCDFGSVRSYEKEIHRILSLFQTDKNIFDLKNELKEKTPNEFSKIYDIHTVPNLVANFLILDVMQQYPESEIKLAKIVEILCPSNISYNNEKKMNNFRKYTLLPRLKEMAEYGFLTINNDKYILNVKFLNNEQKTALKYVVPFFCGIYPFSSIGHFIANRLEIRDIFKFEGYSIKNVLDDCLTFDLLNAINNEDTVRISIKNKEKSEIKPTELILDKESQLLKVIDYNKNEYFLHEIEEIENNKKVKNPIFSEIYSFYYKIFEELANEYKKDKNCDKNTVLYYYGSKVHYVTIDLKKDAIPEEAEILPPRIYQALLLLAGLLTLLYQFRVSPIASE